MPDADHVTGFASRGTLEAFLEGRLTSVHGLAVTICDVVGLKQVNEQENFLAGDAVLRNAADRLRNAAAGADLLARLGGDELVAVFTGPEAAARASATAKLLANGSASPPLRAGMLVAQADDTRAALLNRLYATVRRS
jgi:diguanylate cyclase (GGDEF)-like protein